MRVNLAGARIRGVYSASARLRKASAIGAYSLHASILLVTSSTNLTEVKEVTHDYGSALSSKFN